MKQAILTLWMASICATASATSAEKVWRLSELNDAATPIASFSYVGDASVYDLHNNNITIDDGSAFITMSLAGSGTTNMPTLGDRIRFEGHYDTDGNTYSIEPSSIIHIDSYQASLVPIIALADDHFDDYPNRLSIFSSVTISSGQDGQYLASLPNGSEATLPASAITPDMIAAKSIVCVPRFDRASGGVTLDCAHPSEQPLTLTKLADIKSIAKGMPYIYCGEATVYYEGDCLVVDDNDSYISLGVEYASIADMPEPGDVITGFTGRSAYEGEGSDVGGSNDRSFSHYVNGNSITTNGKTHDLTPIVASDDQTFDSYINRLSQYGQATLTISADGSEGIITLANGSQAVIIAADLPAEGAGTYEWVRGIPIRLGVLPFIRLYAAQFGTKAGVDQVTTYAAGPSQWYDLKGVRLDSRPVHRGIYIETHPDGSHHKHAITSGR